MCMESSQNNMLLAAIKVQNAAAVEASSFMEAPTKEASSSIEGPGMEATTYVEVPTTETSSPVDPPFPVLEAPAPESPPSDSAKKPITSAVLKPPKSKSPSSDRDWERFSFICSKDIIQKIHDISEKEHFSIREVMELFLQRGISDYEKKNGVAKARKKKSVDSIL